MDWTHLHTHYYQVCDFVWRLIRNRILTTDNLIRWSVLTTIDQLCVGGCDNSEDANHFFLHCEFFWQIWNVVYDWLGFILVDSSHISDHLIHFVALGGSSKKLRAVLHLVWFSTIWVIWQKEMLTFSSKIRTFFIAFLTKLKFNLI